MSYGSGKGNSHRWWEKLLLGIYRNNVTIVFQDEKSYCTSLKTLKGS
jgi:hypothetical protein